MGFYGNITNTTSSQFTFDKIYPNREAMDAGVTTDGVYVNRFVLIEYDVSLANALNNNMTQIQESDIKESDDGYEIQVNGKTIKYEDIKNDSRLSIVYTCVMDDTNPNFPVEKNHKFYGCEEEPNNDNLGNVAIYKLISQADNSGLNYITNYHTDQKKYGVSRGYDSTVWQKMYMDGTEKYVMIAELNSVVPTFDVSPDAPTMGPIVPHFDKSSTNVYYKLHWQAPWGFRVAGADDNLSDEQTVWYRDKYDSESGTTIREYYDKGTWRKLTEKEVANKEFPKRAAAIYYNKEAFDPQVNEDNTDPKNIDGRVTGVVDEIKIAPTGKSGNKYNKHDGTADLDEIADIQEMTIHLPAIGNMMSDAWDIIHGPARNNSKSQSLQGILDTFTEMGSNQIPYKRESNGEIVGADLTENDWIKATLDDTTKKINIVHKGSNDIEVSDNPTPINFNSETSGNQFSSYALEETDKGHVKKVKRTPIILPNGFNEIKTANGNSLVAATTPRSAFKIATDNWIHVEKPEGTNDTLKLYHEARASELDRLLINENKNEDSFAFQTFYELDPTGHIEHYQTMKVFFPNSFSKVETDEENSSITAGTVNSAFKIGGDNTWTETEVDDNNKILVKHKAKEKPLKEKYYEDDLYTDTFFDAKIDAAGHITEYKQKNIPASLSIIYAHEPNKTEPDKTNPFKISASSAPGGRSVDIFGDSFIKLKGKTTTEGSYSYNSGFVINHALTDEFQVSSSVQPDAKTIITYNDLYDDAGHRSGRVETTYTLPNYYSAITIPSVEGSTLITPNTEGSIILKGNSEDIKIGNSTKTTRNWITVSGDKDNNTILIDHNIPNSEDPNQIKVGSIGSAQIPYFDYDSKGHIIKSGVSQIVGDDWLSLNKEDDGSITISHNKLPSDTEKELTIVGTEDAPTNPKPGQVITVPYIKYDEKGHIVDAIIKEVTLPSEIGVAEVVISDDKAQDENGTNLDRETLIMDNLSINEKGQVVPWYKTTNTLKLNEYAAPLSDIGESTNWLGRIESGDTLNKAFGKLEYQLSKVQQPDFTIGAGWMTNADEILANIRYIDKKLHPLTTTTKGFRISGYSTNDDSERIDLTSAVTNGDSINAAFKKLSFQISGVQSGLQGIQSNLVVGYTPIQEYDQLNEIKTIQNGISLNDALLLIEKNTRILCMRIAQVANDAGVRLSPTSPISETSLTDDEIEQIANNLDNV